MRYATLFVCLVFIANQLTSINAVDELDNYEDEESSATTENLFGDDSNEDFRHILTIDNEIPVHTKDKSNTSSTSDDIIILNVGGQRIATYRSTLTAVPNSKLALMFANRTKSKQEVAHFFDYNPQHFQYLLDQLRNLKFMPQVSSYELDFPAPAGNLGFNYSFMLSDLGLNSDRFLSPLLGTHVNLKVNNLVGWKLCYRGKYDTPFDEKVLTKTCTGKRLLVGCRTVLDRKTLIVAGVGKRDRIFEKCNPNSYCSPKMYNGTGFYYSESSAWGFQGQPEDLVSYHQGNNWNHYSGQQGSTHLSPCDTGDQYSEYRLCWSLRSIHGRGGGDRCGSSKNLHNTKGWERVIYHIF